MSHCIPCIGANRIQDAKSRKYILITFAVFVNRIQSYFIKILKEKVWAKHRERLRHFMRWNVPSWRDCLRAKPEFRSHRHMNPWNSNRWRFCEVFSFSITFNFAKKFEITLTNTAKVIKIYLRDFVPWIRLAPMKGAQWLIITFTFYRAHAFCVCATAGSWPIIFIFKKIYLKRCMK